MLTLKFHRIRDGHSLPEYYHDIMLMASISEKCLATGHIPGHHLPWHRRSSNDDSYILPIR